MKKFIKKVILLVIIILACAVVYDVCYSYIKMHDQHRVYVGWSDIYNDTTNYDLVINGNSRAWVQYNPMILDTLLGINSYNLGIDGSCIDRQIIKYRKYCQFHGQPKYLIQNLEYFTMDTTNGYEQYQFFPYFVFDRSLIRELRCNEKFNWADLYIPYYRYLGVRQYDDGGLGLYKGYQAQDRKWDHSTIASMDTVHIKNNPEMVESFAQFIEEQCSLGTKVIFVYAPIYIEATQKCYEKDIVLDIFDSIAKSNDVAILNYIYDKISYDSIFFYNASHLNPLGAELFSKKLVHDIDSIGFLR